MKTKSGNKIKKNKIPICPKKVKPVINIIKINPQNKLIKHHKHPSTPLIICSKKFETKISDKTKNKNGFNKSNVFQAIILKRKSNSEKKYRNKIISIKNREKLKQINQDKNIDKSKYDKKCDTTNGINRKMADKNIKQKNIINTLEFTFSNTNFNRSKNDNSINRNTKNNLHCNKGNINYSYHKKNKNNKIINLKKNNSIKNMKKCFNQNNKLIENNIRSISKRKKEQNNKNKDKDNISIKNKTSKISNKFKSLIPYDKNHTNINNKKNNIDISHALKDKYNPNKIHKLLISISPQKILKKNKSNPKLFKKHPSLKNFFEI